MKKKTKKINKKTAKESTAQLEPNYLTIKKTIEVEESYTISQIDMVIDCNDLERYLADGTLNIIQHATIEPYLWVVHPSGKKVALLEKDGGVGPSERVTIKAENLRNLYPKR
jgi:hypothetical protein